MSSVHKKHPGTFDRMVGNKKTAETGPSSPKYLPKGRKVRYPKLRGVSK